LAPVQFRGPMSVRFGLELAEKLDNRADGDYVLLGLDVTTFCFPLFLGTVVPVGTFLRAVAYSVRVRSG
jgi:hypothetical protein